MNKVNAIRVDTVSTTQAPGAFGYYTAHGSDEIAGLIFRCPCGCGSLGSLDFREDNPDKHPSWTWDKNIEAPTLTPSVQRTGGCEWHGFLTAGVWISC